MLKIKKNDKVIVLSGRDKGRTGEVAAVFPKKGTALIPGVNLYKKHLKPRMARDGKGGIVEIVRPISVSKIALVDPKTGKPTRVGFAKSKDEKTRIAKKSGGVI
jgi:large subunit ribosomal protein L24